MSKVLELTGVSLERCVGLSLNRNLADRTIFDFSANVNLRTLTLSGHLDVPDLQFQTSVFTLLESSFLAFPRNNHLQDISIRLSLWSDVPARCYEMFTQHSSWGPLASVLLSPTFFALEKAEIIASICRLGEAGEKTAIIPLIGDS
ncbi:hypothetical protein Hypma_004043 [Hypsizygus marmoreus]|uniref:Uncharacterized protein n=1 Tax=Hypsizygus marmoreus TaxID=39966 RepID=A0A369J598_HYPMA|nr:hypothetical protein Hypma_004043 [Hypsizygus marmoreus]